MAEQWPGVQVFTPLHFTLSNKKLGNMYSVSLGRLAIGMRPTSLLVRNHQNVPAAFIFALRPDQTELQSTPPINRPRKANPYKGHPLHKLLGRGR